MSKYQIKKISLGYDIVDGVARKSYEDCIDAANSKELFSALRDTDNSSLFYGKGADIFRDGQLVAHTNDVKRLFGERVENWRGQEKTVRPTVSRLIEIASEDF